MHVDIHIPRRVVFACLLFGLMLPFMPIGQRVVAQTAVLPTPQPVSTTAPGGAMIGGTIINGTTGAPLPAGLPVVLYAFNSSYTRTETLHSILAADGSYSFDVSQQPSDWVYMVGVTYNEIEFTSDIGTFENAVTTLSLPVAVYEQTTDADAVVIDQLQVSLAFTDGQVQVHELYTFDNRETAVFIGEAGDSAGGTVAFMLPEGAISPEFQRGMGPSSGYFPANEVFQSGDHWYDTYHLRPGATSLTMLVTYRLPDRDGITLAHTLPYAAENVSLALPADGVTLDSTGWQQLASRPTGSNGGVIRNYSQDNFAAGALLTIGLSGRSTPQPASPPQLGVSVDQAAWMLSVIVLLTAVTFIIRLVILQRAAAGKHESSHESEMLPAPDPADLIARSRKLVIALAVLDEGYDKGWIDEAGYHLRRQNLKAELKMIWDQIGNDAVTDPQSSFPIPYTPIPEEA